MTVATDHKLLLKVFGDRQLCEMENPRLTNLKEKAMYFRFDMVHMPGRFHKGPDAMSRVPRELQDTEQGELAGILEGSSTKELRLGFLKTVWGPKTEEGLGDIPDQRTKRMIDYDLQHLGIEYGMEDQTEGAVVYKVSGMEEKQIVAMTWAKAATSTDNDADLKAIKDVIELNTAVMRR